MEITDIRMRKIDNESRLKATSTVTFDNEIAIHDIKVIQSEKGLFMAMPSKKTPDGEFVDIAHPINSIAREKIQAAVIEKYLSLD